MTRKPYDGLANKTDGLQGCYLEVCVWLSIHKAEENFNEIGPLSFGELDSSNSSDDLRCEVTSLLLRGAESDKGILFDLGLGISAERKPPMSKLRLPCAFLEIDRRVRKKCSEKEKEGVLPERIGRSSKRDLQRYVRVGVHSR